MSIFRLYPKQEGHFYGVYLHVVLGKVISIGDHIQLQVFEGRWSSHLTVGITAPKEIPIYRREILEAVRDETERSVTRVGT